VTDPGPSAASILVVDDDGGMREMVVAYLREQGYAVTEAADPVAALAVVGDRSHRLDLVVTDLVMPKMSGPHFVERLRELRPQLAILRVSGYPRAHHPQLAPDAPFLQKPFTLEVFQEAVEEALASKA
jgi:hypothetical protein